jgi:hypothetical protein
MPAESPLPFFNLWNKEHKMPTVTDKERTAAQETDPTIRDARDVIKLEEMAALYVQAAGDDADLRAIDLVNAAKAAGRIDDQGNFIGG